MVNKAPAPRLKLVVRRLPPTLPEATFWQVVEPWTSGALWKRYVAGRPGDNYGAHPVHSRAYVLMPDVGSIVSFHSAFDGHIFRSKAGAEYQAVVEFAPVEKTPHRLKEKKDPKQGTIDNDADYLSFLRARDSIPEPVEVTVSTPAPQPESTPLLDALRAQASKSKQKQQKKKEKAEKAKSAALASINDAAKHRAPTGQNVIMVAGSGREVYVQDSKAEDDKEKDKPKKSRRKKAKKPDGADTPGAPAGAKEDGGAEPPAQPQAQAQPKAKPKPKKKPQEKKEDKSQEKPEGAAEGEEKKPKSRNRGRGRGGGGGGAGGGGGGGGAGGGVKEGGEAKPPKAKKPREPKEKSGDVRAAEARIDM